MDSACLRKSCTLGYGVTLQAKALPHGKACGGPGLWVTGRLYLSDFLGPVVGSPLWPFVQATFSNSEFSIILVHTCIIFCLTSQLFQTLAERRGDTYLAYLCT